MEKLLETFLSSDGDNGSCDIFKILSSSLEDESFLNQFKAYMKHNMFHTLKQSNMNCATDPTNTIKHQSVSLKMQSLNLLIADYLLRQDFFYTLSVFSSEAPCLKNLTQFSSYIDHLANKSSVHMMNKNSVPKFLSRDVKDILECLGLSPYSEESIVARQLYMDYEEGEPLILCLIKSMVSTLQNINRCAECRKDYNDSKEVTSQQISNSDLTEWQIQLVNKLVRYNLKPYQVQSTLQSLTEIVNKEFECYGEKVAAALEDKLKQIKIYEAHLNQTLKEAELNLTRQKDAIEQAFDKKQKEMIRVSKSLNTRKSGIAQAVVLLQKHKSILEEKEKQLEERTREWEDKNQELIFKQKEINDYVESSNRHKETSKKNEKPGASSSVHTYKDIEGRNRDVSKDCTNDFDGGGGGGGGGGDDDDEYKRSIELSVRNIKNNLDFRNDKVKIVSTGVSENDIKKIKTKIDSENYSACLNKSNDEYTVPNRTMEEQYKLLKTIQDQSAILAQLLETTKMSNEQVRRTKSHRLTNGINYERNYRQRNSTKEDKRSVENIEWSDSGMGKYKTNQEDKTEQIGEGSKSCCCHINKDLKRIDEVIEKHLQLEHALVIRLKDENISLQNQIYEQKRRIDELTDRAFTLRDRLESNRIDERGKKDTRMIPSVITPSSPDFQKRSLQPNEFRSTVQPDPKPGQSETNLNKTSCPSSMPSSEDFFEKSRLALQKLQIESLAINASYEQYQRRINQTKHIHDIPRPVSETSSQIGVVPSLDFKRSAIPMRPYVSFHSTPGIQFFGSNASSRSIKPTHHMKPNQFENESDTLSSSIENSPRISNIPLLKNYHTKLKTKRNKSLILESPRLDQDSEENLTNQNKTKSFARNERTVKDKKLRFSNDDYDKENQFKKEEKYRKHRRKDMVKQFSISENNRNNAIDNEHTIDIEENNGNTIQYAVQNDNDKPEECSDNENVNTETDSYYKTYEHKKSGNKTVEKDSPLINKHSYRQIYSSVDRHISDNSIGPQNSQSNNIRIDGQNQIKNNKFLNSDLKIEKQNNKSLKNNVKSDTFDRLNSFEVGRSKNETLLVHIDRLMDNDNRLDMSTNYKDTNRNVSLGILEDPSTKNKDTKRNDNEGILEDITVDSRSNINSFQNSFEFIDDRMELSDKDKLYTISSHGNNVQGNDEENKENFNDNNVQVEDVDIGKLEEIVPVRDRENNGILKNSLNANNVQDSNIGLDSVVEYNGRSSLLFQIQDSDEST